jgi:hypothetical protein
MIEMIRKRVGVMNKDDKKKEPTDIVKHEPAKLVDNFEGWDDGVEGDDRPQGAGIIQGTLIKFTNEYTWVTRDGEELPKNLELCPVDILRVVQKWHEQQPIETIVLEPHQKFPDTKKMNEEAPKAEWIEGPDSKMRGPWQAQHIVYLLDPKTMDKYTFPTSTAGGAIAVRELRDKIVWMRKFRGPSVYPTVLLSDTFFPTRFGGRQRPHFKILPARWVRFGGEGDQIETVSGPTPLLPPTTTAATPAKPAEPTTAQSELPLETVKEPSLKEEMGGDEIPFNDPTPDLGKAERPKASAPPLPNPRRNLKKPIRDNAKKAKRRPANILDAG